MELNGSHISQHLEKAKPWNRAGLVSEGRTTSQGRLQAGTGVIVVKKECTTLLGQRKVLVKTRVMTRVSISEVSRVPTETAALAELKNTHPGKVLFLPPDAEQLLPDVLKKILRALLGECGQTFTPKPLLVKSSMIANSLEELRETGLQAAPADHCYAEPEDMACEVCTGRKLKALKTERQRELGRRRQQIQKGLQDRERDVKLLQQEVEAINGSADKAVNDSEKIFSELIRLLEKRSSDVNQQIRSQQETEASQRASEETGAGDH
ncbi:unnamed protein product [Pleuronectes platessa]|uniref:TRIM8/14/16/25/29/45/65 coiled-coil region domain-containing protein n=1 Tax=Pleuronectes platessa TaxID=8262 RepID=A0A9N7TQP8_PLEPL|nr:unnamed protein product [Pleuronectes platessa]